MRIVVTGQIGLDKKQYIEQVVELARVQGESLKTYHIGEMMYAEAGDIPPGHILDLPLSRLDSLRRAVFRDILADLSHHKHTLINTHATFRWKHGLFAAFDFDQLTSFDADLYVCLVDNIETVHERMLRDHELEHSLKDLMVWREEEILATEILAKASVRTGQTAIDRPKLFVLARGRAPESTAETLYRLIFRPDMKRIYPSFPMTHVYDQPAILAEVNAFRSAIAGKFTTFDPGDLDEKCIADAALQAAREGQTSLAIRSQISQPASLHRRNGDTAAGHLFYLKVADILAILPDIDGQIYARDFLLVRQSEIVISYIPELPNGKPGLSSGVERELQHAHDHGRETYVIWKPAKDPSPFISQTANKVFHSVEEAFEYFEAKGYFRQHNLFCT